MPFQEPPPLPPEYDGRRLSIAEAPLRNHSQIFLVARNMHVFFANPEPSFLVADRLTADFADPIQQKLGDTLPRAGGTLPHGYHRNKG